ncbi:H-2 class I histocompatibility antigen, Q10 alpha chain-like isoform X3 [Ctenopharyngodon idella]|uniref:H-2 class I histocompatibility antigen, Q10 alpha chain-like isoform X3 n=1 Tax=Ctenopharyngodon idella TaxID=7959 RepID=UPI0022309688|nr:H-2 class I histocompatibility antigen, Q10 alpha chain-like isoform X3 [Ctenopharyngodon idella]
MTLFTVLCSAVLLGAVVPAWSDKHSLYYIYTALSKPVNLPGIYEFTAMGLLDDRQIDYYNSKEKRKIPTQHWMKEKMQEDYWEKGTQSRKSKEQWFNVNVNILMNRMRDNESDVHVLQWRHGCEIEKQGNELKFSKGIDEYSYDGENFLSFDDKESQWVAPVDAALPTKRKWDNVPILNQYTKGYLEKECVDWLNKFREYGDEELRNGSPPDVHVFARRCTSDKTKLKLTCMATGFYPKDVILTIRKYRTSLPEKDTESTQIRPNHDGTFQQRKSVNIKEDEKAEYDCFVSHSTLKEPVIVKWDGQCKDCTPETVSGMIGAVIGGLLMLAVVAIVFVVLKKKRIIDFKRENVEKPMTREENKPLTDELDKTGSMTTISTDSGKGSAGASTGNSASNSQEEVNNVVEDSSGEDKP